MNSASFPHLPQLRAPKGSRKHSWGTPRLTHHTGPVQHPAPLTRPPVLNNIQCLPRTHSTGSSLTTLGPTCPAQQCSCGTPAFTQARLVSLFLESSSLLPIFLRSAVHPRWPKGSRASTLPGPSQVHLSVPFTKTTPPPRHLQARDLLQDPSWDPASAPAPCSPADLCRGLAHGPNTAA